MSHTFKSIVVTLCLLTTGCAMSYEEYEERVKYCESNKLRPEAFGEDGIYGGTRKVFCINKDGIRFPSKVDD